MIVEIKYYLTLFRRRLVLFVLVFSVLTSLGIFAAFTLPPVYRSQARLLVESSQIPDQLATSTVETPAKEQLQLFEARLMARENLLTIANDLRPFPDQAKMNPDQIVEAMKSATKINSSTGRDQATLMTLAFENPSRGLTAAIVDEYLTFILEEDAQFRALRAGQTEQFFRQEVDRLSSSLSKQSARILEFKESNANALPEGLDYRRNLQLNLRAEISQIERELVSQIEQKERLTQVFDATGRLDTSTVATTPEAQRLRSMKAQLSDLEAVYAAGHPKLVNQRNRIEALENSIADNSVISETSDLDPADAMFQLQITSIETRIKQLDGEKIRILEQLSLVEANIAATPSNAIKLEALERDYDNILAQYNTAVDRSARASTGERIETLSRGQRVTVIEQPSIPSEPFKPNRKLVAAFGALAGFFVGAGLIIVLELLNTSVKRPIDLVRGLQITPLATIPYVATLREQRRIRFYKIAMSLLIFVAVPSILWAVHTYFIPFDIMARRLAAKFGFYI